MSLAGECYLFEDGGGYHLHIFLTDYLGDPPQAIIVNITSWRKNSDETCIIQPGEHPFIRKKSVVLYGKASIIKESNVEYIKRQGKQQETISNELLYRMHAGLCKSKRTSKIVKEFYQKHHT